MISLEEDFNKAANEEEEQVKCCVRISTDEKEIEKKKVARRKETERKKESKISKEDARLDFLKESILNVTLTINDLKFLKKDDNYSSDAMLALVYYHHCRNDPKSCVLVIKIQ